MSLVILLLINDYVLVRISLLVIQTDSHNFPTLTNFKCSQ
jgi:hypothetical protein